jgi:hypothetical protein
VLGYSVSLDGVSIALLTGFFEGWPNPPRAETDLSVLTGSTHAIVAGDCALPSGGGAERRGSNADGELGDGDSTTAESDVPKATKPVVEVPRRPVGHPASPRVCVEGAYAGAASGVISAGGRVPVSGC